MRNNIGNSQIMKSIFFTLLVLYSVDAFCQNKTPEFKPKSFSIVIPSEVKGVAKDTIKERGDDLKYEFNGVYFKNKNEGLIQTQQNGFAGSTNRSTPFELVTELFYAWQIGSKGLIKELYTPESSDLFDARLPDSIFTRYQNIMKKEMQPRIVAAYQYKEGYMVITEFENQGMESVFCIQRNNRYYIQPIEDDNTANYNFEVFLENSPEPFQKPTVELQNDTIGYDAQSRIKVGLTKRGNYIVLFRPDKNSAVFVNMPDNASADLNNGGKKIEFDITLGWFLKRGKNVFYAIESNFPVRDVSERMIKEGVPVEVFLK